MAMTFRHATLRPRLLLERTFMKINGCVPSAEISSFDRGRNGSLLRQSRRGKTVFRQRALAFHRRMQIANLSPAPRRRSDRQSVVGSNRQFVRQLHDLLRGILPLRDQRIGAIGKKDIGGALRDGFAVRRTALRRGRADGPPVSAAPSCRAWRRHRA